ncbi:hypothetical protein SAMN00777080_1558 [Aquiflexum balticum DSM 16537]|uniref:Uncharacterized protein n=1 Tax=Aquiflexum balticum DSM 16537 TaxID=758820 RepID=A0A1W2H1Z3_9BACT|nr:hypothetical protein SAMN00777080_1558 [Aquiflexum balticum DSM 16537]
MNSKTKEVAKKRKKIIIFLGLVILLTLAFAIKKIYFAANPIEKGSETLSMKIS